MRRWFWWAFGLSRNGWEMDRRRSHRLRPGLWQSWLSYGIWPFFSSFSVRIVRFSVHFFCRTTLKPAPTLTGSLISWLADRRDGTAKAEKDILTFAFRSAWYLYCARTSINPVGSLLPSPCSTPKTTTIFHPEEKGNKKKNSCSNLNKLQSTNQRHSMLKTGKIRKAPPCYAAANVWWDRKIFFIKSKILPNLSQHTLAAA